MQEHQYIETFWQMNPNWTEDVFVIKKIKNTFTWRQKTFIPYNIQTLIEYLNTLMENKVFERFIKNKTETSNQREFQS